MSSDMVEQQQRRGASREVRRRRAGILGFAAGAAAVFAFFAFFPGLPHVIDWGAVLAALAVGALVRWGVLVWWAKRDERDGGDVG
ncbi:MULTISPECIES: hypothetical protein [unclassified Streptomyces]|uniref:hypothetical protein n=1 Tax=unclassified Streptomyces TaxID=2593676 RepID=UPI003803C3D9